MDALGTRVECRDPHEAGESTRPAPAPQGTAYGSPIKSSAHGTRTAHIS